jgi:prepilin-type N-terminal cleavage/methylation domain-containing protein
MKTLWHACVPTSGFTLIELLVVMGLVVLLAAGFSLTLRPTSGSGLRNARYETAGLLARARVVALGRQSATRLVIHAADSDGFMRLLQVFSLDGAGSWNAVSPAIWLPRGVWVVPPAGLGGARSLARYTGVRSTLAIDDAPNLAAGEFEGVDRIGYLEFEANGEVHSPTGEDVTIALAAVSVTGEIAAAVPVSVQTITVPKGGGVTFDASP